jgi:hypothetical protein
MVRCALLAVFAAMLCSCAHAGVENPGLVIGAGSRVPSPPVTPAQAPPAIVYAQLSSVAVARHSWWSGRIITGTNVASVVVSLPFFSFEVPRRAFGDFSFRTYVTDVPPVYHQRLYGSIIAYNTAGASVQWPIAVTFK